MPLVLDFVNNNNNMTICNVTWRESLQGCQTTSVTVLCDTVSTCCIKMNTCMP